MGTETQIDPKDKKNRKNEFVGNITKESSDMLRFIDWNERRHRVDAMTYLKEQSFFTKEKISHNVH